MKSLKLYLIIAGALLIVYIIAQFNRPKEIDWRETLSSKAKTPFGTYVLYDRIKDLFPGAAVAQFRMPVYNVIADDSVQNASYVIICQKALFLKTDYDQLTKYIKQGNDVFIAAQDFGSIVSKNVGLETDYAYNIDHSVTAVRFLNPSLNHGKDYHVDKDADAFYFSKFDTLHTTVLGENSKHKANFIRCSFGKGRLYLCANPKIFSNYSLLTPDGAEYAATALSYVKNTKEVLWDEYYTQGDGSAESPMRLFFSNPALEWAYYVAIFSLVIFVLYEIKRRQRFIPVIEPLSNSTLDFVNVVGQVYYEKRNNANIARKKILYLLEYLRETHQLKTNKLDSEFIEKLSAKLGIETSFANELVNYIQYINVQERVSDHDLIELNKLIEKLYIKSA